jgi:hypothetical protein
LRGFRKTAKIAGVVVVVIRKRPHRAAVCSKGIQRPTKSRRIPNPTKRKGFLSAGGFERKRLPMEIDKMTGNKRDFDAFVGTPDITNSLQKHLTLLA